jgi:hypothetical protein
MKPLELALIPTPGAKPEFLATVIPLPNQEDDGIPKSMVVSWWQSITEHNQAVVLEGYTRHSWVDYKNNNSTVIVPWQSLSVRSVDGKNKLPGFINYLQERQKTAYGRFLGRINMEEGTDLVTTFVWVVSPPKQKQQQPDNAAKSTTLSCRIVPLMNIPECPLKPKSGDVKIRQQQQQQQYQPVNAATASAKSMPVTATASTKRKGFGLLGNLVGAQKRTNQHVTTSAVIAKSASSGSATTTKMMPPAETTTTTSKSDEAPSEATYATHTPLLTEHKKTSSQLLADFRNEMEQSMLDFDIASEVSTKVPIKLSEYTKQVLEADQDKVTMEVLKYIVFEQAEEVNEDWIAHQEPSEYMDEVTIAIYKDAEYAPPEVLEELNRVELPEEIKAQQRLVAEQRRQQELKALKEQEQQHREALKKNMTGRDGDKEDDLATLNTQKRDRRTIEEIQRDNAKRAR